MVGIIQEFKQKIGQEAERIIATGLNLEQRGKKYRCLNPYAHRNGDNTPSMSWDPNRLQFYCFGCGLKIDIYSYYKDHLNYTHKEIMREFGMASDFKNLSIQKNRETFMQQVKLLQPITQECIDYILKRGITKETIDAFELQSYKGRIAFPYYKYETLVGVKTRLPKKYNKETDGEKMLSLKGSKPYLFNAKNLELGGELIVCEGEFDCMVLWQCGYKNVVSGFNPL
jgi:twinkle protein